MEFVILGGSGIQGQAIVKYLFEKTKDRIFVVDPRPLPEHIVEMCGSRLGHHIHSYSPSLMPVLEKDAVVVSCLPTEYNLEILRYCVEESDKGYIHHFVDLGGSTETALEQLRLHDKAVKAGSINVLEAGIAPGIISSMAADISKEEGVIGIRFYCGGLPKYPEGPHYHAKTFYTGGIIKEYLGIVRERRNGKVYNCAALTGEEKIFIPGLGVLFARRTSGGLSTSPFQISTPNLSYKTLRFPGHWEYINDYVLHQKDPSYVLDCIFPDIDENNPDILVLSVHIDYEDGDEIVERYYFEYDHENKIPAMAQATGYVVGAVATMIKDNLISAGVNGMEQLDIEELCKRALNNERFSNQPIFYKEEEE